MHISACLLAPACVVPPDHQSRCCNMTSRHKQAPICSYTLSPDRKILLFFSFALCRRRNLLKNFSVRTLLSVYFYVEEDHRRLPVVCDFQQGGEPIRKHPFVSCLVHHLADSAPQQSPCLASHPCAQVSPSHSHVQSFLAENDAASSPQKFVKACAQLLMRQSWRLPGPAI